MSAAIPRLLVALVTTGVILLLCGPVLGDPTTLALGRGCSEAPQHLWSLWLVTEHLLTDGPLVRRAAIAFPDGFVQHLIDPTNLLLFSPVYWLAGGGPGAATLAWNLLHAGSVLIGAIGCALLARHVAPGAAGAAVLVAGFVGSSALLDQPETGRSEYLPVLWLPLHLALLREALHRGSAPLSLGAGAALALVALGGPYIAVFSLPVVVTAALAWAHPVSWDARLRGLSPAAAVAGAGAAFAIWSTLRWPPSKLLSQIEDNTSAPLSQSLAPLLRLGDGFPGAETTLYPGVVVLLLGFLGAALAPRRAIGWLALGLSLVAVGVGPTPTLSGIPKVGPAAALLEALPLLRGIFAWPRMGFVAALPLGLAAAVGAQAAAARLSRPALQGALGLGLAALVLADHATFPRSVRAPARTLDAHLPAPVAALIDLLPPGALLHIPLDGPTTVTSCPPVGRYLNWSLQHGRPITTAAGSPNDAMWIQSWLLQWVTASRAEPLPRSSRDCARADSTLLLEHGVVAILLHGDDPRAVNARPALTRLLGRPSRQEGEHSVWVLADRAGPPVEGCQRPGGLLPSEPRAARPAGAR